MASHTTPRCSEWLVRVQACSVALLVPMTVQSCEIGGATCLNSVGMLLMNGASCVGLAGVLLDGRSHVV